MNACKVEYTWWRWPADRLETSKKYFSSIEQAESFCESCLLHHKDWRIIKNGNVVQTMMGKIIRGEQDEY